MSNREPSASHPSNTSSTNTPNNENNTNDNNNSAERPHDDVGTPSEHSSIAREPDSTGCSDCRELRGEVHNVKQQLQHLFQLVNTYYSHTWPTALQQPPPTSVLDPTAMVTVGTGVSMTPWQAQMRGSQEASRPSGSGSSHQDKTVKEETSSPSDDKTSKTTETSTSSGPAPMSHVSLSSNDDESSDSGERSGESTEMTRMTEQLMQSARSAEAGKKRPLDVKQEHLAPPASAPPTSSGVMQLSPAHMAMLSQQQHHPLVSPPHHPNYEHDAKRMRSSATLVSPVAINLLHHSAAQPIVSPFTPSTAASAMNDNMHAVNREMSLIDSLQKLRGESAHREAMNQPPALTKAALKMDSFTGQSPLLRQPNNGSPPNLQQLLALHQQTQQMSSGGSSLDPALLQALLGMQQQQQQHTSSAVAQHLHQANLANVMANKHQQLATHLEERAAQMVAAQSHQSQMGQMSMRAQQLFQHQQRPPMPGGGILGASNGGGIVPVDVQVQHALEAAMREQQRHKKAVVKPPPVQRAAPDDFVREFVESSRNEEPRESYVIPVAEAAEADPSFRPVSEEQILHSVKWHELDLQEAVTRLAKKLAEKRVFGPNLMAKATVAGTNHSNYSNLPIDGIRYIEEVCRRQLCPQSVPRQRFIDSYFRPAMKGLAARCRRIRHSQKPQESRPDKQDIAASQQLAAVQQFVTQSMAASTSHSMPSPSLLLPSTMNQSPNVHLQQLQLAARARLMLATQQFAQTQSSATAVTPPATTTRGD